MKRRQKSEEQETAIVEPPRAVLFEIALTEEEGLQFYLADVAAPQKMMIAECLRIAADELHATLRYELGGEGDDD